MRVRGASKTLSPVGVVPAGFSFYRELEPRYHEVMKLSVSELESLAVCTGFLDGPRLMKDGRDCLVGIEEAALTIARSGKSAGILALANATNCLLWPDAGRLMNDEKDKDLLAYLMRQMARKLEATDFLMVSEVWTSYQGPNQARVYARPADDPNRQEAIVTLHETAAGITMVKRNMVRRGSRVWLEGPVQEERSGMTHTGRFCNIIRKPAPNVFKMQGGA